MGTASASEFSHELGHKLLRTRRTKIVATIGPASQSAKKLRQLIRNGLNVARINFSHGEPEERTQLAANIRKVAESMDAPIAILADLCGPKVRVGRVRNGAVTLTEKSTVTITTREVCGDETLIPSQYKGLVREAQVGERILLDDGNLELKVTAKKLGVLQAKVVRGGILKDHKGMNLPDTEMQVSALTAKDRKDAQFCIDAGVDFLALSFVRSPKDIRALKKVLAARQAHIPIIAKIEKPEALANIDKIIEEADGIMVARGDLGVEMPPEKVPLIQNRLIALANEHNKPVIVATQMLESMMQNSRPTRAEV